jgi:molybdopterin/thiamine biosynthesis adenylyltransferase
MSKNRNDRQVLAFGEEGQRDIEAQNVVVVGVGGLGAHISQGLAYLGVIDCATIDHDKISITNLNRTPGAYPSDIDVPKVVIARRHFLQISPDARAIALEKNLRSKEAIDVLTKATTIFGCVDHDGPRLILMELAAAYGIDYIDAATEIFPASDKSTFDFGGRVVFSKPGQFCLNCADQIDLEAAKQDLEDDETKKVRRAHGYGLEQVGEAPSVFSLNGIIANLALTEFMVSVTGIRAPEKKLSYRGMRGIVTASKDERKADCFTCGYLAGKKHEANILRYALS